MDSQTGGNAQKSKSAISDLISTEPIVQKKVGSRSALIPDDEEKEDAIVSGAGGEVMSYRLYRRRWLGLSEYIGVVALPIC